MSIFKTNKTLDRLNRMIDNAIDGKPIESGFDESRASQIETKLSKFLAMNSLSKTQLNEEKSKINELISDISHQTKTPLANILLYTQLLMESDLNEYDKSCVNSLMAQAEKLNFLISSLIKTSRLETRIISVSPKHSNIHETLIKVVSQAEANAKSKNINLTLKECDIYAEFDPKWTAEALYNIIDNAIKYTQDYGNVIVSAQDYTMFCRIDVTDDGIGISEEEIPKIFSRFYRSPKVNHKEGVGIGLYLAREIVVSQGGYIKVNSKENYGSTFSIFLPKK